MARAVSILTTLSDDLERNGHEPEEGSALMTGAEKHKKPEMRLRATVHVEGCGTNNNLDDTYSSDVIADFIMSFALYIATNCCSERVFEVTLTATPATIPTKAGEFNEKEWREMLMGISLLPKAPIELLTTTVAVIGGIVQARYTFLLVNAP